MQELSDPSLHALSTGSFFTSSFCSVMSLAVVIVLRQPINSELMNILIAFSQICDRLQNPKSLAG